MVVLTLRCANVNFVLNSTNLSNFRPLEFVGRCRAAQLQLVENVNAMT